MLNSEELKGSIESGATLKGVITAPVEIKVSIDGKTGPKGDGNATILYALASVWDAQTTLVAQKNTIYVYYESATSSNYKCKVGDGTSYLIDMPFTTSQVVQSLTNHINDTNVHLQTGERASWNNKLNCRANGEELIFFV